MAAADPARCSSCGAEHPQMPRKAFVRACVLRHAMKSGGLADRDPRHRWSRIEPVLDTLAKTAGSVPRVQLLDAPATTNLDDSDLADGDSGPAMRGDLSEISAASDADGRLELLGEIARGGMGAVLKGRDTDLGRDLAVKVLLEAHRDKPDLVRRFIEEAQIAGQLQHPGIVPVYELGAFADHRPFFTMKLVKGRTLAAC